jgi:hypothetical protein
MDHKASRTAIFKDTIEEDQRLERYCFHAPISKRSSGMLQPISSIDRSRGTWQVPKGGRQLAILRYDTND